MLRTTKSLIGYRLAASDGILGSVHDLYFDDDTGQIRHVVVDLGRHIPGRKVLLEPLVLGAPDWVHRIIPIPMSREEIRRSPRRDADKPVFRQIEEHVQNFYEWAPHWTPFSGEPEPQPEPVLTGDTHLRSVRHLTGYAVETADGVVGRVGDFVLDDATWTIRLVVLDPRAAHVVVEHLTAFPLGYIASFDWNRRRMRTRFENWMLADAPEYHALCLDDPAYEQRVRDHYARSSELVPAAR